MASTIEVQEVVGEDYPEPIVDHAAVQEDHQRQPKEAYARER